MTAAAKPQNDRITGRKAGVPSGAGGISPALVARLAPETPLEDAAALRALLVARGFCAGDAPAVSLELYGGLRLRTGCEVLPLHAETVGAALEALRRIFPVVERLLPNHEELGEYYRFSINGKTVTTDLEQPLAEGDQLILFSASVGG
jgi:molybdopterin converting factor small subunit